MHWHDAGRAGAAGEAPSGWGAGALGDAILWLRAQLVAERERWPLWFPAALGLGIGVYFSLPAEPAAWVAPLGLAAATALVVAAWRRGAGVVLPAAFFGIALGFAAAQLQTWLVAAPVLERRVGPVTVEGRLVAVDPLPEGARLVIVPSRIDRLDAARLPARVRVRLRRDDDAMIPGADVAVKAELYPPPPPAMPGAFDFERRAFFDRIGAVGFAFGRARQIAAPAGLGWAGNAVEAVRTLVAQRIRVAFPDASGGIAAALLTGDTHAIAPADAGAFRDAGLAHILVIAGLHMGMVAGIVFFAMRAFLALIPAIALNYPTKKWAAATALAMTFGYMLLSGATVSSRRAFVMIGLALFGVLVDRLSLSPRAVAYAAIVVMLMTPESATGPSFQMSFAAVGALIAFYEALRPRLAHWHARAGAPRRFALYLLGIALTTVVTTAATMPFTIYHFHFNRFPLYSVVANALAVPVTGFWIMPWGILACLLMPFRLEALALTPMSLGINLVSAIAHRVTSWPGAILQVPSMPAASLMLLALGGLWLCIWQRRWRWLGLAPVAAGVLAMAFDRPPDLLIAADSRLVAVRGGDGAYLPSSTCAEHDAEETWVRRAAAAAGPAWPAAGQSADGSLSCDIEACLYRARGRVVALERDAAALAEDCAQADLVVSPFAAHRPCRGPLVIDRIDTWRSGAHAVWLDHDRIRIETVRQWQGERPWVPQSERISSAASARRGDPEP